MSIEQGPSASHDKKKRTIRNVGVGLGTAAAIGLGAALLSREESAPPQQAAVDAGKVPEPPRQSTESSTRAGARKTPPELDGVTFIDRAEEKRLQAESAMCGEAIEHIKGELRSLGFVMREAATDTEPVTAFIAIHRADNDSLVARAVPDIRKRNFQITFIEPSKLIGSAGGGYGEGVRVYDIRENEIPKQMQRYAEWMEGVQKYMGELPGSELSEDGLPMYPMDWGSVRMKQQELNPFK